MPPKNGTASVKVSRGPMSCRPKSAKKKSTDAEGRVLPYAEFVAKNRVRDAERVQNCVEGILAEWKKLNHDFAYGTESKIIKVSLKQLKSVLIDLKNTRWTKIPSLINDTLVDLNLVQKYGSWIFVEHDSPDYLFIMMPPDSTDVVRLKLSKDKEQDRISMQYTSEVLLDHDSVSDEDDTPNPDNWPLETLQEFVANNEIYVTKEEFEDRPALRNAVREFYKKS